MIKNERKEKIKKIEKKFKFKLKKKKKKRWEGSCLCYVTMLYYAIATLGLLFLFSPLFLSVLIPPGV